MSGRGAPDALDSGRDLGEVRHRLDPDHIDAARDQLAGLLLERADRVVALERAERRHDQARRADVPRHQRIAPGGIHLGAQEDRGGPVELGDAVLEVVQREPVAVRAERVGEHDPRTRVEVAAVDAPDDVGVREVPDLGRVAELEPGREQLGPHRAIGEDRRAAVEELLPAGAARCGIRGSSRHSQPRARKISQSTTLVRTIRPSAHG